MKMSIDFEETIKHKHNIIVIGSEKNIDNALSEMDRNLRILSIEDVGSVFEKHGCEIEDITEDFDVDTDNFEYYDEQILEEDDEEEE